MKFFHLGDLHFGKMLHQQSMAETDQKDWIETFLTAVDQYQVDAVVIAGDIYDRKVPSPEAMRLFDHLLTELARRDRMVFVIPGNHDSSVRLSHVSELLTSHQIYIAGELSREMMHITVREGDQRITFWLMPYLFPKAVGDPAVLDRDDLGTYDEAARALIAAQKMDPTDCNILVAHQNVLASGAAPEHSESETIIGGLGEIDCSAFDAFDYVALGHIHNAQKVGRETIRYAGCPLYYDFSEINRSKALTLVTVQSKENIQIERVEIPMPHRLRQLSGTLEELLSQGIMLKDKDEYYFQCILTDKHVPPRAMERLREVYGERLLNVKRSAEANYSTNTPGSVIKDASRMSLEEQFTLFYQSRQNELPDGEQERLLSRIMEQQERRSGDFYLDDKFIPEKDSAELIDLLLEGMEDGI